MPRTGSWSSWRSAADRWSPRRRRGACSPSARRRSGSRGRCSPTSSRPTRGSPGTATRSHWPAPLGADLLLEEATYVVVDLETTGLRPGIVADLRDRRRARCGLETEAEFETLVNPGMPIGAGRRGDHRATRPPAAGGSAALGRGEPLPRLRRRRGARRAQRALRPLVPRPRDRAPHRVAASPPRSSTPCRSRAGCSAGACRARASRSSRISSARRCSPATARCPMRRRPAEVLLALIGLAQERGARTVADLVGARGHPPAARLGQAAARVRRAPASGRLPLPRPQRAGALRRPGARPAGAAAVVLPLRATAAGRRGGARRSRADRVAGARLGARGGAGGAAAHPRAAAAGERARRAAGPLRLATQARRRRRRIVAGDAARADPLAATSAARRARAARKRPRAAAAASPRASAPPRASSPTHAGTRTPRGCATGSTRSSSVCRELERLERLQARASVASWSRRPSQVRRARSSSRAGGSPPSATLPARRRRAPRDRGRPCSCATSARADEPPATSTSCSSSALPAPAAAGAAIVPLEKEAILRAADRCRLRRGPSRRARACKHSAASPRHRAATSR